MNEHGDAFAKQKYEAACEELRRAKIENGELHQKLLDLRIQVEKLTAERDQTLKLISTKIRDMGFHIWTKDGQEHRCPASGRQEYERAATKVEEFCREWTWTE